MAKNSNISTNKIIKEKANELQALIKLTQKSIRSKHNEKAINKLIITVIQYPVILNLSIFY